METFNRERAQQAWDILSAYIKRLHVMRKHVTDGGFPESRYRRLQHGDYGEHENQRWLTDLSVLFDTANLLIETPPRGSKIRRGQAVTWEAMFGTLADFPSPPGPTSTRPGMDAGASELGADWDRTGVAAYEQQLQIEKARYQGFGDASKLRQVIEKLATFNEAIGDWEDAVRHLHDLHAINAKFQDDVFVADCCLRLGIAYYRLGRWAQAKEVLNQGSTVVRRRHAILGGSKTELRLLGYSGLVKLRLDQPKEALRIFDEQVWPLVERHGSTYVTATFHHRRALIHSALRDYDAAHADIERALQLRLACEAEFEVTRTLFYLGRILARQHRTHAAVAVWKLCEQRHLRFHDALGMARVKLELAGALASFARAGTGDQDLVCDIGTADLSDGEIDAIRRLAKGFYEDAEGVLRTVVRREELSTRAEDEYSYAIYWAGKAGDSKLSSAAEQGLLILQKHSARR